MSIIGHCGDQLHTNNNGKFSTLLLMIGLQLPTPRKMKNVVTLSKMILFTKTGVPNHLYKIVSHQKKSYISLIIVDVLGEILFHCYIKDIFQC